MRAQCLQGSVIEKNGGTLRNVKINDTFDYKRHIDFEKGHGVMKKAQGVMERALDVTWKRAGGPPCEKDLAGTLYVDRDYNWKQIPTIPWQWTETVTEDTFLLFHDSEQRLYLKTDSYYSMTVNRDCNWRHIPIIPWQWTENVTEDRFLLFHDSEQRL